MGYRLNLILLLLLVAILAIVVLLRADLSRPNFVVQLGNDMTYSPAYGSYEVNSNFHNGRTLQEPVPGTTPLGLNVFRFEATPAGAVLAGEQLANPIKPGSEAASKSVARGADAFTVYCTSCHGGDGSGNGPVPRRGFPPPPSLLVGKSREMKDGQLFHILTCGQNSMPNFAAQLTPPLRWDLINFIRQIQSQAAAVPAEPPVPQTLNEGVEATSAEGTEQTDQQSPTVDADTRILP